MVPAQENATEWHDETSNRLLKIIQPKPELRNTLRDGFVDYSNWIPSWYVLAVSTVLYRVWLR